MQTKGLLTRPKLYIDFCKEKEVPFENCINQVLKGIGRPKNSNVDKPSKKEQADYTAYNNNNNNNNTNRNLKLV